jgi:hypothetical protein
MLFGAMALACALGVLACRLGYVRLKATIAERDAQAIAALAHASRFEASGRGIWLGLLFVPLIAMFGFGLFAALREGRIVYDGAAGELTDEMVESIYRSSSDQERNDTNICGRSV